MSALLEEFGDEWGNKWMMHYRWYSADSAADAEKYARKIAVEMNSGPKTSGSVMHLEGLQKKLDETVGFFKERMLGRGFTVGSNEITAPVIEKSFIRTIALLDAHLAGGGTYSMKSPYRA